MSKYQGSIDLQKLPGARFVRMEGKRSLIIPVEDNPTIVVGAKGIYLNLFIGESKNNQYGNTNYIVPSISTKEEREALSETRRKEITPIIGNLKPALQQESIGQQAVDLTAKAEDITNDGSKLSPAAAAFVKEFENSVDEESDLPF